MAFRQYRRASSGVDAGVNALLFWATVITAPIWVPVLGIVLLYSHCTANSPQARAERARIEVSRQAERAQQERRKQEAALAAAHAPWDSLRCEALLARLDRATRMARSGSDSAAVEASNLRQQSIDHSCKRDPPRRSRKSVAAQQ